MYVSKSIRRGIDGAYNLRKFMHRTGRTPNGRFLWSQEEIDILDDLWPDKQALAGALMTRTPSAISSKAQERGLKTPRKFWQPDERGRMVPPYKAGEPIAIVVEKVQTRNKRQIYSKAAHLKVRRPRRAPKLTGMRIVDLIRDRAFKKGYTMRELDEWSGCRHYFVAPKKIYPQAIMAALRVLDGRIQARWQ